MAKVGMLGVVGFCCLAACENGGSTGEVGGVGRPRGGSGPTVEIAAQRVESGFARGVLRQSSSVDAFRISRYPITIGEYRKCVAARRCAEPPADACPDRPEEPIMRRANYNEPEVAEDVAVTCVGVEAARSYCSWVSGELPTLEQWFLAARGGAPQLHSWGESAPTCEQHALAGHPVDTPCPLAPADIGRVGLHTGGVSPLGLEDVLLTTSELLQRSDASLFSACKAEKAKPGVSPQSACIVYSSSPGSIDSVARVEGPTSFMPYGFRCVWEGA